MRDLPKFNSITRVVIKRCRCCCVVMHTKKTLLKEISPRLMEAKPHGQVDWMKTTTLCIGTKGIITVNYYYRVSFEETIPMQSQSILL
jgi:hypothetical protein